MSQLVGQGVAGVYPRDVFGDIGPQGVTHGAGANGGLHKGANILGGIHGYGYSEVEAANAGIVFSAGGLYADAVCGETLAFTGVGEHAHHARGEGSAEHSGWRRVFAPAAQCSGNVCNKRGVTALKSAVAA